MKTPITIIRAVVALVAVASPLLAAVPASLLHFTRMSEWPGGQQGFGLAVSGDYAYVRALDPHLRVIDVSHPTNPIAMGSLNLTNNEQPSEVLVSGQHAFLRYYSQIGDVIPWRKGGFHVFDVSDAANPVRVGSYAPGHGLSALEVCGSYAYVAFYNIDASPTESGLRVLDLSNPAQPVPLGVCTNVGGASGMAVLSNRVYLANGASLKIIDVSDPQQPTLVGSFQTMEWAYDVAVAGNHAYVVTGRDFEWPADSGLEVIDVSNPAQPQRVGIYHTSLGAARITLHGRLAYVISDIEPSWRLGLIPSGVALQVFDLSDPANPLRVDKGNLPSGSMSDVAVANGHLFLPKHGIYRIDEVPAVGPTLNMKRGYLPGRLELWAQSPGFDDFTLMTSTTVTNWQPVATVFSRLENSPLSVNINPQEEPARFYRAAGEVLTPAAMSLQWKAAGIPRYQFRFERRCLCNPKVLSGLVTVEYGTVTRVEDALGSGTPINEPNLDEFNSIEGLFGLLQSSLGTADLMIIKRDAERHFPILIAIDWNVEISDATVTYQITDLVPIE